MPVRPRTIMKTDCWLSTPCRHSQRGSTNDKRDDSERIEQNRKCTKFSVRPKRFNIERMAARENSRCKKDKDEPRPYQSLFSEKGLTIRRTRSPFCKRRFIRIRIQVLHVFKRHNVRVIRAAKPVCRRTTERGKVINPECSIFRDQPTPGASPLRINTLLFDMLATG